MDRLDAIERLARLREAGVLTDAEYSEQKRRVIGAQSLAARPAHVSPAPNRLQEAQLHGPSAYPTSRDPAPQIHIHNTNLQQSTNPVFVAVPAKSVVVAYLLWLFLGGLGVHRFYLGRSGSGIALLLLSLSGWAILMFGIGFAFLAVAGLWLFIDLFLIPGMAHSGSRIIVG